MRTLRHNLPAVWAALFAVLLQLSLGQAAMAASSAAPGQPTATHICGEIPATPGQPAHRGAMDCLQCPLCAAISVQATSLYTPPTLPNAPSFWRNLTFATATNATLNIPLIRAAEPRGPPVLS